MHSAVCLIFLSEQRLPPLIHLDDVTHWNYKGKIECEKCGTVIEIEIRNGEVIKARRTEQ
jgi:transcription initiation factor TFIIIB Brf1 subunit/transcription initiation factor TFIIB